MKWYNNFLIVAIGVGLVVAVVVYNASQFGVVKVEPAPKKANIVSYKRPHRVVPLEPEIVYAPLWKTVEMNVSAYCPCVKCCENFADGITASGLRIKKGDKFVAAPRNYKFGTEMKIPGYNSGNVVKVEDVGGAIKGNKLDLYFDTHKEALQFGRQYLSVKVKL